MNGAIHHTTTIRRLRFWNGLLILVILGLVVLAFVGRCPKCRAEIYYKLGFCGVCLCGPV